MYDCFMQRTSSESPRPGREGPPHQHPSVTPAPAERGTFLLATCQGGAEASLVRRQELILPTVAKAVWRRGMVTFRLESSDPPDDFFPDLVFARAVIRSLGQVSGASDPERVAAVRALVAHPSWDTIHVWHRDRRMEPEIDAESVRALLLAAYGKPTDISATARPATSCSTA